MTILAKNYPEAMALMGFAAAATRSYAHVVDPVDDRINVYRPKRATSTVLTVRIATRYLLGTGPRTSCWATSTSWS